MKPGDIVYRYTQIDGRNVMEPVEVLRVEIATLPDEQGQLVKVRLAEIRTQSGEIDVVQAGLLTAVPYLPGIEQIKAREDPKDP